MTSERVRAASPTTAAVPSFLARSPLLGDVFRFARDAHHGPRRKGDTDISHPVEVARLLERLWFREEVLAAALLHDVIEDTQTEIGEIQDRFGSDVAELVAALTEDRSIEAYEVRKEVQREQVRRAGADAAAIFAADKLARVRALRSAGERPPAIKLHHYEQSLAMLERMSASDELVDELRYELERLTIV
jgi:(p)ppGpp synthase/HD superfamily hydrolase